MSGVPVDPDKPPPPPPSSDQLLRVDILLPVVGSFPLLTTHAISFVISQDLFIWTTIRPLSKIQYDLLRIFWGSIQMFTDLLTFAVVTPSVRTEAPQRMIPTHVGQCIVLRSNCQLYTQFILIYFRCLLWGCKTTQLFFS